MSRSDIRWEYKTIRIKPGMLGSYDAEKIDETLRPEGHAGWELVNAICPAPLAPILLILKRQL
jgi:hypothetical protein